MKTSLRISVLTNNYAGSYTLAEHGLSLLVETDGKRILFDTGQSDLFLKNAGTMNILLEPLDMVVLSHGHFDHGNGLSYLTGNKLLCHPECFQPRYHKNNDINIGLALTKAQLASQFDLITSAVPFNISERIIFLGGIPRISEFESKKSSFVLKDGSPDFVMDDSAMVAILDEGLFVITGCGHSGIINTLEYATKVTGENILYGITGGFHLKDQDNQTVETIKYLKEKKVRHILPCHCTSLPAMAAFYEAFRVKEVFTGAILEF